MVLVYCILIASLVLALLLNTSRSYTLLRIICLVSTVHIFADWDCNTLGTLPANQFFRKIVYYFCLIMNHASD